MFTANPNLNPVDSYFSFLAFKFTFLFVMILVSSCPPPHTIHNGGFKMIPSNGVGTDGMVMSEVMVVYYCKEGFKMSPDVSSVVVCQDGIWNGDLPRCRPKLATDRCGPAPEVSHAKPYVDGSLLLSANKTFPNGAEVLYVCQLGYKQHGSSTVTCDMGEWSGQGPVCVHANSDCNPPQIISHGDYSLLPRGNMLLSAHDRVPENSKAYYYCHNGFKMKETNLSVQVCLDGEWHGQLSACGKSSCLIL